MKPLETTGYTVIRMGDLLLLTLYPAELACDASPLGVTERLAVSYSDYVIDIKTAKVLKNREYGITTGECYNGTTSN